jgi:hypothetical protein
MFLTSKPLKKTTGVKNIQSRKCEDEYQAKEMSIPIAN